MTSQSGWGGQWGGQWGPASGWRTAEVDPAWLAEINRRGAMLAEAPEGPERERVRAYLLGIPSGQLPAVAGGRE